MFCFSKIHAWQNDQAVMQLNVYSSLEMKQQFESQYLIKTNNHDPEFVSTASDTNMGIIYKLRAVLNSDGLYIPIIRCGFTGQLLWESRGPAYKNHVEALVDCLKQLQLFNYISDTDDHLKQLQLFNHNADTDDHLVKLKKQSKK